MTKDTQARRKLVLDHWARANGANSPQEVIDRIVLDKVGIYDSVNLFLNYVRDEELAPSTISLHHSILGGEGDQKSGAGFFLSCFGEENFSVSKFNRLCPGGDSYTQIEKKAPEVDELRLNLRDLATPRDKALLGGLAVSGFRISEWLSRKMTDIKRKDDYGVVKLSAGDTKKRYKRVTFLIKEVLDRLLPQRSKSPRG